MEDKKKVPKLRFPGFTDDWEQRKLGELFNFHYGDGNNNPSNGGKYPVFGAGGIQGGYTKYNAENSVIIGHMGDAGCVSWGEGKHFVTYNGTITKPKDEVFSAKFGYYLLLNMDLRKYRGGSGLPFLTYDMLTEMETKCSNSKIETQKIADYFTHLDHLITLHQRQLDNLKNLKKGCLQKMFPRYGETKPELRFPGFTDDWKQRKLSEISDVRDGTHDSPSYINEGHPFVTSKNVKDGYINYDDIQYISDEDFEAINKRSKVDINDILMGMIGTIGNLALIRTEPDFAIKNVALIKDTKQVWYMYLYHYLQSPSTARQLLSGLDGGTQKFVSLKNIRELNIMVPSEAEQIKVGTFIETLDNLITLHQRELDELNQFKKGMLQQMFV